MQKNKNDNRVIDKAKIFLRRYGVSIGVLGCAAIAAAVFFLGGNNEPETLDNNIPNDVYPPLNPVATLVVEPLPLLDSIDVKVEPDEKEIVEPEPIVEVLGIKNTKSVVPDLKKPVDGEVILEFARDRLVYSTTLLEYSTHLGMDFAGELGQAVSACADGKVSEVGNDKLMGNYIIIKHSNRLKSAYYGFDTITVKKGDKVKANDVLGSLGNSMLIEVEAGPHIHFEVLLDDEKVDPIQFFVE